MEISNIQWKYINEGNAHIVLQILNTDYVLRLVKEDENAHNLQVIQNFIKFVNNVMVPLIFDDSQYCEELIEISSESLAYLSKKLLEIRPPHRRNKSNLSKYAIKAPNLTMISPNTVNYCLEIKPKEGFMSTSLNKLSKCFYCLKQYLKLQAREINHISSYCPLNLFSGDRKRMKRALLSLAHNPQNNFKMFKDGEIIYNEKSDIMQFHELVNNMGIFCSTNIFLDFVIDILLSTGDANKITNETEEVLITLENDKCVEANTLKCGTFLYKLLTSQKLTNDFVANMKTSDGSFEYVSSIITVLEKQNLQLNLEEDRKKFFDSLNPMHRSLISAVARDCSIMISFSPESTSKLPNIQVGDLKISYRTSVTDLEPKPATTLLKRKITEEKLIETYHKYVNSKQYLEIQPHLETRGKQLEAWEQLIAEYMKVTKQSTIDIRESNNSPLFNNASINRKLSQESILTVLEQMAKTGKAAPIDKSKNVWEIYWHSLDEWGNMVYSWVCNNGMNNSVCTIFELVEGENTVGEEFHGLDTNVLLKALRSLEAKGKCELIQFDDNQGVKFF